MDVKEGTMGKEGKKTSNCEHLMGRKAEKHPTKKTPKRSKRSQNRSDHRGLSKNTLHWQKQKEQRGLESFLEQRTHTKGVKAADNDAPDTRHHWNKRKQ